ncbi:Scr1 family TA system antitoxin-like transcriptional regulator [Saccharopolyspora shandongensis]|uniref:Scr1 family TA system antitoxin-like transcriptional regulator n=1 Tax=Saccharopolyspora shandongensis TaxID=418495 RepID=UPI003433FA2F
MSRDTGWEAGSSHLLRTAQRLPNRRSGQFFHERDDVGAYQDAVSWLRDVALSPDDSAKLIAKVITEMESDA